MIRDMLAALKSSNAHGNVNQEALLLYLNRLGNEISKAKNMANDFQECLQKTEVPVEYIKSSINTVEQKVQIGEPKYQQLTSILGKNNPNLVLGQKVAVERSGSAKRSKAGNKTAITTSTRDMTQKSIPTKPSRIFQSEMPKLPDWLVIPTPKNKEIVRPLLPKVKGVKAKIQNFLKIAIRSQKGHGGRQFKGDLHLLKEAAVLLFKKRLIPTRVHLLSVLYKKGDQLVSNGWFRNFVKRYEDCWTWAENQEGLKLFRKTRGIV